jgi:iron complex outermembrane receptor protein
MSTQNKPSRGQSRHTRNTFMLTPIAAACSALLLTSAAYAQEADQAQVVVVTGIRGSIESSITAKKNSEAITEVLTAEDIGKLPDTSIAESLARLPGLAGQRVGGRAQVITIRGMSPDFAGTLLNGREQVTSGDNRGVEFDQFPSELINGATVYKTPDAALLGQGLSGTIDMHSIRPLDFRERKVNLNARAELNSNGALNPNTSARGSRLSGSYVNQFANRTLGVAVGFAHLDSPMQEKHYQTWGLGQNDSYCAQHTADGCSPLKGLPPDVTYMGGFEAEARSKKQVRDGLMAVLQYKPSKDFESTVDMYYSKFKQRENMRGLMGGSWGNGWGGKPGSTFTNVELTPMGSGQLVTSSTFNLYAPLTGRNDYNTRDDKLKSIGWNTRAKLADQWTGVADLSYSNAARQENVIETNGTPRPGLANLTVKMPTGAGYPTIVPDLNYADAKTYMLGDVCGGCWYDGTWRKPTMTDTLKALRLEAKRDMDGFFHDATFGFNYSTRDKTRTMNSYATNLKNGRANILVPDGALQSPTSLAFTGIPGVVSYDVMSVLNSNYDVIPIELTQIVDRNYEVHEKVSTAYAKLGIDTELGSVAVRGNLGVQLIHTDQSSHGYSALGDVVSDVTRGTTYNNVLPSLNLNFELPNDSFVRVGVAKTLARARMDDIRAGNNVSINVTSPTHEWGGSGGNPDLKPWLANSFDLSFERYFGKRSYVAAAGFYKKLLNYIYTQTVPYDFTGIPNPTKVTPASNIGLFSTPVNGQGGIVKGIELSGALDAGLLIKALDGFGIQGSASRTLSSIHPDGPDAPTKLPGLSGTVANVTVYYEKNGFSTRISERYRSAFRGEINGLFNMRSFAEITADKQTDLQISYEFDSGSWKGLSVLLQVNNVTNSPYKTVSGKTNGVLAPLEYSTYGRQTLLGATYKF